MTHPDTHPNAFKLSLFIGHWTGSGQVFATPWGEATKCAGIWQFGFDRSGLNMIHDYQETRENGSVFNGHGVFNIEPSTKDVIWFWFDSFGFPPFDPARGTWDLDKLVLMKATPRGIGRSTFVFTHNRFQYTVEAQPKGTEDFLPVMAGEFTKIRNA